MLMKHYLNDLEALQYDPVEVVPASRAATAATLWKRALANSSHRHKVSALLVENGSVRNLWFPL